MEWRNLGATALLLVVLITYACDGSPISRSEKLELEETLDKMNTLLDKLAKTLDDASLESELPQHTDVQTNPSEEEEEPAPDEPQIGEGGYNWDLDQQQRSWDDGPEPEAVSVLEPRTQQDENPSLRSALRYLMQLQKQRQSQLHPAAAKRDHDIPFPFLDSGYGGGRWGNH